MSKKKLLVALGACLAAGICAQTMAATPKSVEAALLKNTGLQAEEVRTSPMLGVWEVLVEDRIYYVDDSARYVLFGRLIDTVSQVDLTNERIRQVARERWKDWPVKDAVKQVFGTGERELVVFSDANCTFCRTMERVYAQVGNLTVYTFITPMLRGETNAREIVCSKDPAKAWHEWMKSSIRPAAVPSSCDASVLQRNLLLANRFNVTGAPTFFFKTGDRHTGAMSPQQLESMLTGQ